MTVVLSSELTYLTGWSDLRQGATGGVLPVTPHPSGKLKALVRIRRLGFISLASLPLSEKPWELIFHSFVQ